MQKPSVRRSFLQEYNGYWTKWEKNAGLLGWNCILWSICIMSL